MRLSLLDRSRTRHGEAPGAALAATISRAQRAEQLGFHRFWVAEHHAVPGIASGSPPVLMAALAGRTQRIRVGSGGVMLPNHAPLVVAEQFLMLESLHPGRIDLGLGRSLGFTKAVREALRVTHYSPEQFADDIDALREYLTGTGSVAALPAAASPPPLFVLANRQGLAVAARAGLPVVVGGSALHETNSGLRAYRENFRPSAQSPQPQVIVSLDVMVANSAQRARELLLPEAWALADSRTTGVFPPLSSVEAVQRREPSSQQRRSINGTLANAIYGTPSEVRVALTELVARTGAAEVLASTSTFDHADLAQADITLAELVA